jgi:NAD(P)-dependent dehydrogenase (short-subunit alcohol dehydrogenase family)
VINPPCHRWHSFRTKGFSFTLRADLRFRMLDPGESRQRQATSWSFRRRTVRTPAVCGSAATSDRARVNSVNLRGVWAAQKHELRQMRTQGSGAIVNCSSLGGLVGPPERAAYHASKHGVIGLTKSAAVEYAPKGIRINAVCPGVIETPMVADMLEGQAEAMAAIMSEQPIGRLGQAEEVAAAALWLCSPGASFVIGVALPVDGGYTTH